LRAAIMHSTYKPAARRRYGELRSLRNLHRHRCIATEGRFLKSSLTLASIASTRLLILLSPNSIERDVAYICSTKSACPV
jgi:hypothetical protein